MRTIREALETAQRLGVRRLNVLTGIPMPGITDMHALRTIIDNLRVAAPEADAAGITLMIENINTTDFPGYYMNTVERAAQLVKGMGQPNVRVQFDQYHVGMMGGDARALFKTYKDLVEHVQIADVPGRHEPGTGHQPIREFLAELDALDYPGAVGLEYRPSGPTDTALAWLPRDKRA
jgi:hydroxypyruvate isomerase